MGILQKIILIELTMVVGLNQILISPKAAIFTMTLLTLTKLILAGGASDAIQYAVKVSLDLVGYIVFQKEFNIQICLLNI